MMKYFKIRYSVPAIAVLFLLFNGTALNIYSNYKKKRVWLSKIEILKQENEKYKKSLYYLDTENSYLEIRVKSELGVIAEGEIEYRFTKS